MHTHNMSSDIVALVNYKYRSPAEWYNFRDQYLAFSKMKRISRQTPFINMTM